jgi:prephenate dehydratase
MALQQYKAQELQSIRRLAENSSARSPNMQAQTAHFEKFGEALPWRAVPQKTFEEAVSKLKQHPKGHADPELFLATENNISGRVNSMALLLAKIEGVIVGEHYYDVRQHLLVNKGVVLEDIHRIYTQRPALDQVTLATEKHGWQTREFYDTAAAARFVRNSGRKDIAAVASSQAGRLYGLKDLGDITDSLINCTRFVHIVPWQDYEHYKPTYDPAKRYKTTIIIEGEDRPLLRIYDTLGRHGFNPIRSETLPNGYFYPERFLVDLETHVDAPAYLRCVEELQSQRYEIKNLGCYLDRTPKKIQNLRARTLKETPHPT